MQDLGCAGEANDVADAHSVCRLFNLAMRVISFFVIDDDGSYKKNAIVEGVERRPWS